MATSGMIGGVELDESQGSLQYRASYFVLDADLVEGSVYWPVVGTAATWAPEYAIIKTRNRKYFGPGCWIVELSAVQDQTFPGGPEGRDDLSLVYTRKYTWGEMFFPMIWWEAHKANKIEAGILKDTDGKYLDRDQDIALKTVADGYAFEGNYLFANASHADKGSAYYDKSPFSSPSLHYKLIEQKVRTKIYTVTFHVQKNINEINKTNKWAGVNPADGFGDRKKGLYPYPDSAGAWRAMEEDIEEILDRKGKKWAKITRRMEGAPVVQNTSGTLTQLTFDSAKDPGKTWTWI
jgi:hypothetical protein